MMRPQIKLINEAGEEVKIAGTDHSVNISFPVGALITVRDGQQVSIGEVLARIPQESQKRSEEHTSELQSLMRISYAVFCLKKNNRSIIRITDKSSLQNIQINHVYTTIILNTTP